jgi:hypothetical protein
MTAMDFYELSRDEAIKAYSAVIAEGKTHSLTDKLLYAIMAQLDKLNEQVEKLTVKED